MRQSVGPVVLLLCALLSHVGSSQEPFDPNLGQWSPVKKPSSIKIRRPERALPNRPVVALTEADGEQATAAEIAISPQAEPLTDPKVEEADELLNQMEEALDRKKSAAAGGSATQLQALPPPPAKSDEAAPLRELAAPPAAPQPTLSGEAKALRDDLRRVLAYYYFRRLENNLERSPWAVMHMIVGFGVDTPLAVNGEKVNAIGWLCWNQPCYGMRLFTTDSGQLTAQVGPGYQGHDGQFLHMMALSRVPKDFGMKVDGRDFTIQDLIKREQATCEAGTELTFKLSGFVHYLGTDATWRSQTGEQWSIERLLKEEMRQPVIGAACGGTHRIGNLGFAVRKRELRGEPMTGQWARAKKYVSDYVEYTYKLQNRDGSFSTEWFEGRGADRDVGRRLQSTGHTLEWLLLSVSDEQLQDPRLVSAVVYLKNLMWSYRTYAWEIGPQGHAVHALALYDERVFGGRPGQRSVELAQVANSSRAR